MTELRRLAAQCEWGELKDDLICSRIVSGITSKTVRERLLRESDLKLRKAIDVCQADELSKRQMKLFDPEKFVHGVERQRKTTVKPPAKALSNQASKTEFKRSGANSAVKQEKECGNCGYKHKKGQCFAYGKKCNKCFKLNHFAKKCRSSRPLHTLRQENEDSSDEHFFLETINVSVNAVDKGQKSQAEYATLSLNKVDVQLKIDTGAEANAIPLNTYKKIAENSLVKIRPPHAKITAYNRERVPVKAVCHLECTYKGQSHDLKFFISEVPSEPVIKIGSCKTVNLVKFIHAVSPSDSEAFGTEIESEYRDIFTGLGCLAREYHIEVDPMIQPVIHPPRKVPHALRDKLKETLNDTVRQEVIVKVDEPTNWVNSLVIVEKNGKLRICIDPVT